MQDDSSLEAMQSTAGFEGEKEEKKQLLVSNTRACIASCNAKPMKEKKRNQKPRDKLRTQRSYVKMIARS